ncbi:hypothetical protein [Fictibacillus phosphorivorans]|uniref:hypothetical protein n=1 Tax=Fictibacillus phosphorivorans TaxID=1221500 RepID=UPI002040F391|nr:hypothetical protein [Fictibacillus phosphorivorans]MCM3719357.1 hypothetical protein [Fictibacillus phosphorivorans]MCM3776978.1 hypothetical protein [Fictibacillus phosphorivorans]
MKRKFLLFLSVAYTIFMAYLCFYYFTKGETHNYQVAFGGILCGAVPLGLILFTKIKFNMPIMLSYFAFLFASQYLGSILGFYHLGWWDTFLHLLSGALLAFVGIALYERMTHQDARSEISSWLVFHFVLSFSVFGGVVWEIYEFSMDQFFAMTLQGGGNFDTMVDLLADTAGGLLIAIIAFIKTKKKFTISS